MDYIPNLRANGRGAGSQAAVGWCHDAAPAVVSSDQLLRGGREVLIRHAGQTYRLRHTRNGKLILTK